MKDSSSADLTGGDRLPWTEKYRPTQLTEIVGNDQVLSRLQIISTQGNMPNILLTGLPGIGKTTSIMCLASALLGPDKMKDAFLELNASDERGIDVVRNSIKMFAQRKVTLPPSRHKIILLDEADSMTVGAQQALRRIMEMYAGTTRFALACNYSTKIIEPIQSRCAVLRFSSPTPEQILHRLMSITAYENVRATPDGLEAVVSTAQGDLRQAIHTLQVTAMTHGLISADAVYKVIDKPHSHALGSILSMSLEGSFDSAYSILKELHAKGHAPLDIIGGLLRIAKAGKNISEPLQMAAIKEVGLAQMRALDGHGSLLQMSALIGRLCKLSLAQENFQIQYQQK